MKYLVTVLQPGREPPAIAVLYCGRNDKQAARAAVDARHRSLFKDRGLFVRVTVSQDGQIDTIQDFPI